MTLMPTDFWPVCDFSASSRNTRGWLVATDDYLRRVLARPELAPLRIEFAAELQATLAALLRGWAGPKDSKG